MSRTRPGAASPDLTTAAAVEELHITEEVLRLDEAFFGPIVDTPFTSP